MVISKGSIFTLVVAVALAFSVNALAASQPKENLEAVVQIHAEVVKLESMSDIDKSFKNEYTNKDINKVVNQCKELRGDDPQCEVTGTEPIVAGLEYSYARNSAALIPKGMDLKKGDLVTEESYPTENKAQILVQKHEKGDCEWTHPFKLAGSGRVECKDDEANGFEDSIFLLKRYPLKHLPESTATHEDGTPLTKLEQYRLKTVVKPVSEDEALGDDVQQAPDVTVEDLDKVTGVQSNAVESTNNEAAPLN